MRVGLIGTSLRENERRAPIHPRHFATLAADVRSALVVETGYGERFGMRDAELAPFVAGFAARDEILRSAEMVILPKPMEADLHAIREGGILWGWLHFVLYGHLADIAVDRRLTVITWESMYEDGAAPGRRVHTFYENNMLAGYGGVFHALGCAGIDGRFGPPRSAVVIGHGYAGRSAVIALQAAGFAAITVYTLRDPHAIADKISHVRYCKFAADPAGGSIAFDENGGRRRFVEVLRSADVLVNCAGQDPEAPIMFVAENEVPALDHPCLIVDVSCDPGMGFPFARTTTFEKPTFTVGRMTVCAVDHTPAYFWEAATWGISKALCPHLPSIGSRLGHWRRKKTIAKAIEIDGGMIVNEKIISYQGRSAIYPFRRMRGEFSRPTGRDLRFNRTQGNARQI